MKLSDAWESQAENWTAWARAAGHDSYWRFHRDRFLELLPPAGRLAIDLGCGEGRLPRDLKERGYRVVGIDASMTLIERARETDPEGDYRVADAAALPLDDAAADLVIAFMSLMDMDDLDGAVREAARVLVRGGRFCIALVHPINSAGSFAGDEEGAPFVIRNSYFERRRYVDVLERDGLEMTFTSDHRSLEAYFAPLEMNGFLVERLREVGSHGDSSTRPSSLLWQRVPLFLHLRARKP